jgi:hypothetical protein
VRSPAGTQELDLGNEPGHIKTAALSATSLLAMAPAGMPGEETQILAGWPPSVRNQVGIPKWALTDIRRWPRTGGIESQGKCGHTWRTRQDSKLRHDDWWTDVLFAEPRLTLSSQTTDFRLGPKGLRTAADSGH